MVIIINNIVFNILLLIYYVGILVRRLIVKTRTKASTLSFATNTELLPNGTVRSAKSDAVELASDFQKKRQRTLQNVENKKHEIEEMFKGKSGKSSLSLRHSNGHVHAKDVHNMPPSPLSSSSPPTDDGLPEGLKLSSSGTFSPPHDHHHYDSLSSSTGTSPNKKPYIVAPTIPPRTNTTSARPTNGMSIPIFQYLRSM